MDKHWLNSYPEGMPSEVDPERYASLAELIDERFAASPGDVAFSSFGVDTTFGEVDAAIRKVGINFARFRDQ